MFEKIENAILLGCEITFKKEIMGFRITIIKEDKKEYVVLPHDHLNSYKIEKYIDLMMQKIVC